MSGLVSLDIGEDFCASSLWSFCFPSGKTLYIIKMGLRKTFPLWTNCYYCLVQITCCQLVFFFVSNGDYFFVHNGVQTSSGLLYASSVPLQVWSSRIWIKITNNSLSQYILNRVLVEHPSSPEIYFFFNWLCVHHTWPLAWIDFDTYLTGRV